MRPSRSLLRRLRLYVSWGGFMRASTDDRLRREIVSEYGEMPGQRLTARQAGRLWGVDEDRASVVLDELVDAHLLTRAANGQYRLAGHRAAD